MASILVIDDDEQIRKLFRSVLEREGYEVKVAPDGKQGILKYRENPADLIIMDIIMPEQEGLEAILELKRDFHEVKIIAISGGGQILAENYLIIAKNMGAMRTLSKPVQKSELLKTVKELIG
jgi:DNA-binding response OmpR family regulator